MNNPTPTLYEISSDIARLTHQLDFGDVSPEERRELEAELDRMEIAQSLKIAMIARRMRNLEVFQEVVKTEQKRLKERAEQLERNAKGLESYLAYCLPKGQKWTDGTFSMSWRESARVEPSEHNLNKDAPPQFLREKISYEPNKELIKETIKTGGEVPGWQLNTYYNLQLK